MYMLSFIICSFTFLPQEYFSYQISISGVDHDFTQVGLKTSELAEMTIKSNDENSKIVSFEITLARGSRAISVTNVKGNKFPLQKLKGQARSGDRLVIELKVSNDKEPDSSATQVIALRII